MAASLLGHSVLGADIERIEPRSRVMVEDFFVAEEESFLLSSREGCWLTLI